MNELIQYVRNEMGNRIGVVVGTQAVNPSRTVVGWSLCRKGDRWDNEKGLMIARNRAVRGSNVRIPDMAKPIVEKMSGRVAKYFKVQA